MTVGLISALGKVQVRAQGGTRPGNHAGRRVQGTPGLRGWNLVMGLSVGRRQVLRTRSLMGEQFTEGTRETFSNESLKFYRWKIIEILPKDKTKKKPQKLILKKKVAPFS